MNFMRKAKLSRQPPNGTLEAKFLQKIFSLARRVDFEWLKCQVITQVYHRVALSSGRIQQRLPTKKVRKVQTETLGKKSSGFVYAF